MDLTQYVLLATVLAGVTELLNRLRARDYWVVVSIVTCVVVGAICGALELFGVPSVEIGVLLGFGTSGTIKALGSVGNKSVPTPSSIVETSRAVK